MFTATARMRSSSFSNHWSTSFASQSASRAGHMKVRPGFTCSFSLSYLSSADLRKSSIQGGRPSFATVFTSNGTYLSSSRRSTSSVCARAGSSGPIM